MHPFGVTQRFLFLQLCYSSDISLAWHTIMLHSWISEVHFPLSTVHSISVMRPVMWCELRPLSFYSQSVLKQQGTYIQLLVKRAAAARLMTHLVAAWWLYWCCDYYTAFSVVEHWCYASSWWIQAVSVRGIFGLLTSWLFCFIQETDLKNTWLRILKLLRACAWLLLVFVYV